MKNYFLFLFISLIIFGCGAKNYNTPFIDTDETVKLRFNMSKSQVQDEIGEPLFVQSGDDATTVWVYEIRTIKVLSNKDPLDQSIVPNKTHKDQRPDSPVHQLKLIFNAQDKLISWEPTNE